MLRCSHRGALHTCTATASKFPAAGRESRRTTKEKEMKKLFITIVTMVTMALAAPAFAQTAVGTGVGIGNSQANAAVKQYVNGSIGLSGLPGGICSDGFTLGAMGAGIGISVSKNPCIVVQSVPGLVRVSVLTRAEGAALVKAAYERLGFTLVKQDMSMTSSERPAPRPEPAADPMRNVDECTVRDDGTRFVRVQRGLSEADKAEAVEACLASLDPVG